MPTAAIVPDQDAFMPSNSPCVLDEVTDLDIVVRELTLLCDRLLEAASVAQVLAAQTEWRARAAVAFAERSDRWARDVSALGCLAETARVAAIRARERAALEAWWACS
jgi:hypothetical protein